MRRLLSLNGQNPDTKYACDNNNRILHIDLNKLKNKAHANRTRNTYGVKVDAIDKIIV